jgi:hypothetical protein
LLSHFLIILNFILSIIQVAAFFILGSITTIFDSSHILFQSESVGIICIKYVEASSIFDNVALFSETISVCVNLSFQPVPYITLNAGTCQVNFQFKSIFFSLLSLINLTFLTAIASKTTILSIFVYSFAPKSHFNITDISNFHGVFATS